MFASESDLNPSRAEKPPAEVTLLAGAGWAGLAELHRPRTEQHRSPPASPFPSGTGLFSTFYKATVAQCANGR